MLSAVSIIFSPRANRGLWPVRGRTYYVNPPKNKTIISRRYNDYWVFSSLPATPVQEWEHFSVAWREPGSAERWIETYRGRAARGYCLLLIILTSARCAHPSSPLVRALAPTLLISICLTSTLLFKCQSHLDIWFVNHIWRKSKKKNTFIHCCVDITVNINLNTVAKLSEDCTRPSIRADN